jgi:hypothetical protein
MAEGHRSGVRFTNFPKASTLTTASTASVFLTLSPQISVRHDCFPFSISMFTIHQIFQILFKMNIVAGLFSHFLSVHSVPLSYFDQEKTTVRLSILSFINKPWPIFFEVLLLTLFLLQQTWPESRARTLLFLISVFIYHPVRSVALRLAAFFGSTKFCEESFCQLKIVEWRSRSRLTDEHFVYPSLVPK